MKKLLVGAWLFACAMVMAQVSTVDLAFKTYAEMSGFTVLTSQTNLVATVSGGATIGDQGNGQFYFAPGSATAADGTNVFASTGVSGRWVRSTQPFLRETEASALYQGTNANLTALSSYGPTTWQGTNANLTALAGNPAMYQSTNPVLTTLAGIGAGTAGDVIYRDASRWTNAPASTLFSGSSLQTGTKAVIAALAITNTAGVVKGLTYQLDTAANGTHYLVYDGLGGRVTNSVAFPAAGSTNYTSSWDLGAANVAGLLPYVVKIVSPTLTAHSQAIGLTATMQYSTDNVTWTTESTYGRLTVTGSTATNAVWNNVLSPHRFATAYRSTANRYWRIALVVPATVTNDLTGYTLTASMRFGPPGFRSTANTSYFWVKDTDEYNPVDWGANRYSSTAGDQTVPFEDAFEWAESWFYSGGYVAAAYMPTMVHIPVGSYTLSRTMYLAGAQAQSMGIYGDGHTQSKLTWAGSGSCITLRPNMGYGDRLVLRDFSIYGSGSVANQTGLDFNSALPPISRSVVKGIYLSSLRIGAIMAGWGGSYEDIYTIYCTAGLILQRCYAAEVTHFYANGTYNPVILENGLWTTINGLHYESCTGPVLLHGIGIRVNGSYQENNKLPYFVIGGGLGTIHALPMHSQLSGRSYNIQLDAIGTDVNPNSVYSWTMLANATSDTLTNATTVCLTNGYPVYTTTINTMGVATNTVYWMTSVGTDNTCKLANQEIYEPWSAATTYYVKTMRESLDKNLLLVCVTNGVSTNAEPVWTRTIGSITRDGPRCAWMVTNVLSWNSNTVYTAGTTKRDVAAAKILTVVTNGTSDPTTEPTWPSAVGDYVVDGTVGWQYTAPLYVDVTNSVSAAMNWGIHQQSLPDCAQFVVRSAIGVKINANTAHSADMEANHDYRDVKVYRNTEAPSTGLAYFSDNIDYVNIGGPDYTSGLGTGHAVTVEQKGGQYMLGPNDYAFNYFPNSDFSAGLCGWGYITNTTRLSLAVVTNEVLGGYALQTLYRPNLNGNKSVTITLPSHAVNAMRGRWITTYSLNSLAGEPTDKWICVELAVNGTVVNYGVHASHTTETANWTVSAPGYVSESATTASVTLNNWFGSTNSYSPDGFLTHRLLLVDSGASFDDVIKGRIPDHPAINERIGGKVVRLVSNLADPLADSGSGDWQVWPVGTVFMSNTNLLGAATVTTAGTKYTTTAWATGTGYTAGDLRLSTDGTKIVVCTTNGTSHATTEPTWPGVGELVTDNTTSWMVSLNRGATVATTLQSIVPGTLDVVGAFTSASAVITNTLTVGGNNAMRWRGTVGAGAGAPASLIAGDMYKSNVTVYVHDGSNSIPLN